MAESTGVRLVGCIFEGNCDEINKLSKGTHSDRTNTKSREAKRQKAGKSHDATYIWHCPAKVAAGKKLIESFVQDGIMSPISSEWAWPGILVPKPIGGWRFVVDLRELNKLIPHDTYEPPACGACLDWLAGRPYRTTLDLLHGFHGVLLSQETRKIFTVVTPFGTYCYESSKVVLSARGGAGRTSGAV